MDDIFLEQIVKRENSVKITLSKIAIGLAAAVIIVILSYTDLPSVLLPFLALGVIAVAILLVRRMNIEYEYLLTQNELDIDAIYSKSSRKHLTTLYLSTAEHFAPVSDALNFKAWKSRCGKITDYSSSENAQGRYFIVLDSDEGKTLIILEPNEKMQSSINKVLPRGLS